MNEEEYKNFLIYLYNEYIKRTIPEFLNEEYYGAIHKDKKITRQDLENSLQPASLMRALDTIEYIKNYCHTQGEIYGTFTKEILDRTDKDIRTGVQIANTTAEKTNFVSIIDNYLPQLLDGLNSNHTPKHEQTLYENLGSIGDPAENISADISVLKSNKGKIVDLSQDGFTARIFRLQQKLDKVDKTTTKHELEWFRSLGQICKGAAILTANVAFAVGLLDCTQVTETDKFKSIASSVLGYGLILIGSQYIF
jgi:hypothetical protein